MAEIFIPLSPAESLLLFNNGYSSRQALKVTFLELIARKILRVETRQEQRVFREEAVQYLCVSWCTMCRMHLRTSPRCWTR